MKKRHWPFNLTPQGLGLKGKDREKAEAYYYLEGEDLDRKLLKIDFDHKESVEYFKKTLELDLKYNKINQEKYERECLDIDFENNYESDEYAKKVLDLDLKFKKITEEDYDREIVEMTHKEDPEKLTIAHKQLDFKYGKLSKLEMDKYEATLAKEPWVGYLDHKLERDTDNKIGMWFELDWNEYFIVELRKEGYVGATEEELVKRWYAELCRTIALEEGLSLDMFNDDAEPPATITKKDVLEPGKAKYS